MAADVGEPRRPGPCIVVVGSASRDLTNDDPRGWRLGGGVTYGALALARFGIRTAALIGLDGDAMGANELDLLRASGVDVVPVPLAHGPVFVNDETLRGRIQTAVDISDPLRVSALPAAWRDAPGWLFAPVAGELSEEWAGLPSSGATVAVGWQGLLRTLGAGQRVERRAPWPSALVGRADLLGVSVDDLPGNWPLHDLDGHAKAGAELLLTAAHRGGTLFRLASRAHQVIRYPAVPAGATIDATGAGDVALAALLGARLADRGTSTDAANDWAASRRRHLLFAATAASLTVEREGIHGVPQLAAIRHALTPRDAEAQPA